MCARVNNWLQWNVLVNCQMCICCSLMVAIHMLEVHFHLETQYLQTTPASMLRADLHLDVVLGRHDLVRHSRPLFIYHTVMVCVVQWPHHSSPAGEHRFHTVIVRQRWRQLNVGQQLHQ